MTNCPEPDPQWQEYCQRQAKIKGEPSQISKFIAENLAELSPIEFKQEMYRSEQKRSRCNGRGNTPRGCEP